MKTSLNIYSIIAAIAVGMALCISGTVKAVDFHGQIDNPVQNIPSVNTFQTDGAGMAGMAVTAFFSAAPPQTAIWGVTGPTSGAAVGPDADWRLRESGDTFVNPWTLEYNAAASPAPKGSLIGFSIDGFAAGPGKIGVMFDRTFDGAFGTPGTFLGHDYETLVPMPFDTFVTFRGIIGVAANLPVGDEFRWLDVRFRVLPDTADEFSTVPPRITGLDGVNLASVEFRQDTNNPLVPEPGSLTMICGISVLGLLRRRRPA